MRAALITALALAACSIPEKHFDNGAIDAPQQAIDAPIGLPDAPATTIDANLNRPDAGPPFGCMGQPLPTTADDPIQLTVGARTAFGGALSGVTVAGHAFGIVEQLGTTDANGVLSVPIPSSGMPVSGYIVGTDSGYLECDSYPAVPMTGPITLPLAMLTTSDLNSAGTLGNVSVDTTKATLVVQVVDCNGVPLTGATVSTQPSGTVRYAGGNGLPSSSATSTDASGDAFIFNVPPGAVTINAVTATDPTFRSNAVTAPGGAITVAAIQP